MLSGSCQPDRGASAGLARWMSQPACVGDVSVEQLPGLLRQLMEARARLAHEREAKSPFPLRTLKARSDLLTALETYAAALTSTGRPVPYKLRDQLNLYRRLSASYPPD